MSNMNQGSKTMLINELKAQGFDFEKNVFELSHSERTMFNDYAKEFRYKKPKNGYHSLGGHFYMHLQKLNQKS